jgi:hypothetical protein
MKGQHVNFNLIPVAALLGAPLLSVALGAQNHLITPPTGTTTDGNDACSIFAWAANQKHRFMDYSHAGKARSIKSVMFRADYRDHNAIGRTWNSVKLYAGHGDYSSIQYNKSTYHKLTSTPTKLFDAKWSFPALSGKPALNPAAWGGVQGSLRFRYSTPFLYNGKDSMFFEFQFTGGVAANNKVWVGNTPKGFEYYLDSMSQDDWRGTTGGGKGGGNGGGTKYGNPKPCYDSWFSKAGAYLTMSLTGATQIELGIQTLYTSPVDPVIYGLSLGGSTTGVPIGASCNNLHLSAPLILLPQPAPRNSRASASVLLKGTRQASMKEFWGQAGWLDSKTRQFKMTNAVKITQPSGSGKEVPFVVSYQVGAFQVWTAAPKGTPFTRYEY